MALWEPVEFPPPRPGQATVVPALPQGPSLGVLAEVMKAAGIPQAPAMPQVAAPAPVPTTPMAEPPAPSAWPTDGVQPPPPNTDFFGRVLRGVMDTNPILDAVPPDIKERALAIFRLYGDQAWRQNTVLGSTVSNIEAGGPKTVGQSWEAQRTASLMRNPEQPGILTEPVPAQPNAPAATDERSIARRRAYEANAAEKKSQMNALGPLSPAEQVTALLSSLVGSAGSPEIAIGPGAAAYAKAGTVGKMALGAGTNAAVVGLTDPANQMSAVSRGDRKDYSPTEHALATGGAAILGAAIPALGALMRRLGAVHGSAPRADGPLALDGEVMPPLPKAPAPDAPKLETPIIEGQRAPDAALPPAQRALPAPEGKPDVRYTEDGIPIIRITPEKKAPPARSAEPAPEQPRLPAREEPRAPNENRPAQEVNLPSEKVGQPDARPAIEAPPKAAEPAPARPEAPVEPAKTPVADAAQRGLVVAAREADGTVHVGKPGQIHSDLQPQLRDANPEMGWVGSDGKFLTREQAMASLPANDPARQTARLRGDTGRLDAVDYRDAHARAPKPVREPSPLSLDTPAPKTDAAGMQTVRAAEQPPEIPDFLRRTPKPAEKPVEAPAPVEPVRAPEEKAPETITGAMFSAVKESAAQNRARITDVRYGPIESGKDTILFKHDGVEHKGVLTGRNRDLVLGAGAEKDAAVANRVMLDGQAKRAEPAPAAPAAGMLPKRASARGLKNQPIAEQAAHHRQKNPRTYRNNGPSTERGLAEYFTPGRLVPSYGGGVDRVAGFDWNGGHWRARVRAVDPKTGDPKPRDMERTHATAPTWQTVERADALNAPKPDAAAPPPREPTPPETPRTAEPGSETPKSPAHGTEKSDSASAKSADHPFTAQSDKPTEMHAGIGSAVLAKAVGPEIVGALVGGLWDHWERYGTPGISWQGALAGAATVAALRHRIPGVGKSVFGKGSYATSALEAGGDLMAKTRVGRWFHPTMGLPADLWDRVVVKTKLETRNLQDDLLKIAKHVRENFTPAERSLMSDWIEKAEQAQHGLTGFQAASSRVRAQADALAAHADDLGQKLADVGMIDRNSLLAEGTYLHRYYMDKQAADPGFREAAKRMQATASYAMRRGEQIEVKGAEAFRVGDKAVQWTNVQSGNVVYKTHGWNGGPEWFPSKEFTVESIDGAKMVLHRDYTPAEREAMGEIRDANYRFTMGSMEASRDLALGRMFKDIAADPRWASATDPGGWKQVPKTNAQGTTIRKWGALGGMYVKPEVWSALDVIRKPWTSEEWGAVGRVVNGYLKALGAWKVGKTAYNPATHFNNLMGNTSLAMLTGEVTPTWVMRGVGELRRGGPAVEEARRAGLSLGREANLGDELTNIKVDVGLATGVSQVSTWGKLLDWYSNNALVRGYQHEDSIFKMGAYMRRRAAGETPEEAVKNVHKVYFDYGDVPLGVQAMRDFYSPFFTYTYKYGQVALREMAERPWRFAAAFGALSAIDMMSYGLLYGDKAKGAADYEQATMPKWLEGRSGFGAEKAITLPFKQKDSVTGEDRSLKLNTRYMIPGGDLLDFTANGSFGPAIYPQALGNTILGGNPLVNFLYGIANGKDSFFDKPLQPYPSTGLWKVGERPTSEILANWGALARFAAFQSLPPLLTSIPDKLGQAAVGEGVIDKKSGFADFMGWTGEDFAGRQKTVLQAIGSALGVKVEDINHAEQERFKITEKARELRDEQANMRKKYRNASTTDSQREGAVDAVRARAQSLSDEARRLSTLRSRSGR